MIETKPVTKVDLQISLARTELRMSSSQARLGSAHYLIMQSQTAFLEALGGILGCWIVPLGHRRRAIWWRYCSEVGFQLGAKDMPKCVVKVQVHWAGQPLCLTSVPVVAAGKRAEEGGLVSEHSKAEKDEKRS